MAILRAFAGLSGPAGRHLLAEFCEIFEVDRPMFAVIKTGGKQYTVRKDDVLEIEKLEGGAGDKVTFDEVLLVGGEGAPKVGAPLLAGASVAAEVVDQTRGPKIIVFKKKRRQNYRRKKGHRQDLTKVKITNIAAG